MKKIKYILTILIAFVMFGCDSYVNEVDPSIDLAEDPLLNSEEQIDFQITGVVHTFSRTAPQIAVGTDLISDMMEYTNDNPAASFPTFQEVDEANILIQNATVLGYFTVVQNARFTADKLLERVTNIGTFKSEALKNKAVYTGNFYGAIARYWLATSFSLTAGGVPGSPIDKSAMISGTQLLDDAIAKAKLALAATSVAYEKQLVNSFLAKFYLAKGDWSNATTHALAGLAKGQAAFNALNSSTFTAYHWGFAGAGRTQCHVADKYNQYIVDNPEEANRIKLASFVGKSGKTYYRQNKYPLQESPFVVMTWQENHLMLAELALRGQATAGNALALVNEVRANYSISPLAAVNLDVVFVERDKELFVQGARHQDQIRFNKWHTQTMGTTLGAWKYLPIPQAERDANPNLQ